MAMVLEFGGSDAEDSVDAGAITDDEVAEESGVIDIPARDEEALEAWLNDDGKSDPPIVGRSGSKVDFLAVEKRKPGRCEQFLAWFCAVSYDQGGKRFGHLGESYIQVTLHNMSLWPRLYLDARKKEFSGMVARGMLSVSESGLAVASLTNACVATSRLTAYCSTLWSERQAGKQKERHNKSYESLGQEEPTRAQQLADVAASAKVRAQGALGYKSKRF